MDTKTAKQVKATRAMASIVEFEDRLDELARKVQELGAAIEELRRDIQTLRRS